MAQIKNAFDRVFTKDQITEAKPETATVHHSSHILNAAVHRSSEAHTDIIKDVLEKIAAYKTLRRSERATKFSKRLVLGSHSDIQAVCCGQTGIVYGLLMPAVHGAALTVNSPFSDYKNVRGMVQQGATYLRRLDSQILSGLLIIMAEYNGDLFRYQPSDTSAQKNALLRTVDREVLIDALLLIENFINSNNSHYIPKLSLILDPQTVIEGLNSRVREWLKTVVDAIYKPDTESYESACAVRPSPRAASMAPASKAKKEAIAVKKEFRDWRKDAKEDINELFTSKLISFKIKTFLTAALNEDNIAAADPGTIDLLCMKLIQLNNATAAELADQVKYFHNKLAVSTDSWDVDEPTFASQAVGSSLTSTEAEGQEQQSSILSSAEDEEAPKATGMQLMQGMSLSERIKLKKAMAAAQNVEQENPSDF